MLSFKGKGFTLIELLIAIVIIGLLATLVMVNIGGATSRARDTRRASDLKQIATALELYYQEYNYYPPGPINSPYKCLSTDDSCWRAPLIPKKYIPLVPKDPKNAAPKIYEYCNVDGTRFVVVASLENAPSQLLPEPSTIYAGCTTATTNWFWVGN
jgi:prepilin-type N-terminal cleavage/methylation domain-containing protein